MKPEAFRAFRSRNFRLFFAGQSLSLLGTWRQKTAVSWVVYAQTHSKLMLGVSVFATLFPSALFSLPGGVVSDRYSRCRGLLATQVLSMAQATLLALAVFRNQQDAVWAIISAFDVPARQSLVDELVDDKQDVPNAVAFNSTMLNLSKLLGPAVAGFAIERLGAAACFGLNALSFVAVIGSLLAMRLPAFVARPRPQPILAELMDGFRYVRDTPGIRLIDGPDHAQRDAAANHRAAGPARARHQPLRAGGHERAAAGQPGGGRGVAARGRAGHRAGRGWAGAAHRATVPAQSAPDPGGRARRAYPPAGRPSRLRVVFCLVTSLAGYCA